MKLHDGSCGVGSVKRTLLAAVFSTLLFVTRLGCGLLTFRLVYQAFDDATFGLYAVLWSMLGFLVLADLGFGVAAQREAGAIDVLPDGPEREERGARLSAIIWGGHLLGSVLLVLAVVVAWGVMALVLDHGQAIACFLVGSVLVFATGIYREILRGRNLNAVLHGIDLIQAILAVALTFAVLRAGGGLTEVLLVGLGSQILANVTIAMVALSGTWKPGRLRIDLSRIRAVARFGAASYGITVCGIIARCDQVLVGSLVGLAQLTPYAVANRLAAYFDQASGQVEAAMAPLVSRQEHLSPEERLSAWRRLFLVGQRSSAALAIPCAIVLAQDRAIVLRLLTGVDEMDHIMEVCAILLLSAVAITRMGGSSGKWMLLMSGGHRFALILSALDAALRLGIGALLVLTWTDPRGMAVGILVAGLALTIIVQPILLSRHLHLPRMTWWRDLLRPVLGSMVSSVLIMLPWILTGPGVTVWHLLVGSGLGGIAILVSGWFFALDQDLRSRLKSALTQRFRTRS